MTDSSRARWRHTMVAVLCCVLTSMLARPAAAVTGNDWRKLPAAAKRAYVSGVVDTLADFGTAVRTLVPAGKLSASEKTLVDFDNCLRKTDRSSSQLVAIVDKYTNENPGERHARMSALVFEALRCKEGAADPRGPKPARGE